MPSTRRKAIDPVRERTLQANARARSEAARTNTQVSRTEQERERTRQAELRNEREAARANQPVAERRTRTSADRGMRAPSIPLPDASSREATLGLLKDPKQSHRTIAACWVLGMAIITWQEVKANKDAPIPKYYVGWTATMGILDLAAPIISFQLAGVFAVGLVIGLMLTRKPTKHDPLDLINSPDIGQGKNPRDPTGSTTQPGSSSKGPLDQGPYQSGSQGPGGLVYWRRFSDGWYAQSLLTWAQYSSRTHGTITPSEAGYPGSDPSLNEYVYSYAQDSWLLKSKLTDPLYNGSTVPTSTIPG